MNTSLLKEIGLTDGEIKVYIALFNLGSTSTGPIVKEAKIHSSKVYPILDRLIEKGLVSFIKEGKKTIYTANPPNTLISFLDKKQAIIKEQKEEAKDLIKKLELQKSIEKAKTEATIFKGTKGVMTAYTIATKDLKKGDVAYAMFLPPIKNKTLLNFLVKITRDLSKKGVIHYLLFNESCPEELLVKKMKNMNIRIGSQQEYQSPAEVCVYGNNTIISTTGGEEHITFLIQNKEIADSFRNQFSLIFKQDVHVSHGMGALIKAHEKTYDALKKGEEYVYMGIPKHQPIEHYEYWHKDHKRRSEAGIKCKLLFNQDTPQSVLSKAMHYGGCDSRYMPTGIKTPSYMLIYKDNIMMVIPKKDPIVIEIKNKEVAKSFKAYFDAFWKLTKKFND